jgi:hypothetical protein
MGKKLAYALMPVMLLVLLYAVRGDAHAQDKQQVSPDCLNVLERVNRADHPESAPALADTAHGNYDVNFKPDGATQHRKDCVLVRGHFMRGGSVATDGQGNAFQVTVHVFSKDLPSTFPVIKVGSIRKHAGRTVINLRAEKTDRKKLAGSEIAGANPAEVEKHVVWLPSRPLNPEVVLCDVPCREYSTQVANAQPGTGGTLTQPPNPQTGGGPTSPDSPRATLNPNLTPPPPVQTPAPPGVDPETKFSIQILEDNETISLQPALRDFCQIRGLPAKLESVDVRTIVSQVFENCIELGHNSDYRIVKRRLDLEGSPKLTLLVESIKPKTVSGLSLSVRMNDGTPITKDCGLKYEIASAQGVLVPKTDINNPPSNRPRHTAELSFPQADWRGATLTVSTKEGSDCQPVQPFNHRITKEDVTSGGKLRIDELVLRSTLGEALIVLNTFSGLPPQHGQGGTTQNYPPPGDASDVVKELLARTLKELKGKVKAVQIVGIDKQGIYNRLKTVRFDDKDPLPKIEELIGYSDLDFKPDLMYDTVKALENKQRQDNDRGYRYKIFIGQSGLLEDQDYCKEFALPSDETVYLYTFGSEKHRMSPQLNKLPTNLKNLPLVPCEKNASHLVLFPEAKRAGWEKVLEMIVSFDRRDGNAGAQAGR